MMAGEQQQWLPGPAHLLPQGSPEMRWNKARGEVLWNGLIGVALSLVLAPVLWPQSFSPDNWHSSYFMEWEVSKAMHPHLLAGINKTRQFLPEPQYLWKAPQKDLAPCPAQASPLSSFVGTATEGYLQVFLEGGLNQQRMGICDAVAVASILNVTLVLPHFDRNPVWQDTSTFADIFDLEHFLVSLQNDVRIVTELPSEYGWSTREFYATGIRDTRIKDAPSHAGHLWYRRRVLPVIQLYGIAAIAPFTHRLSFDDLPPAAQKLRCRVNFDALRFKPSLRHLGDLIVRRLHGQSPWKLGGFPSENVDQAAAAVGKGDVRTPRKYLALHLRFDKDMAAHSACDFQGGRAEERALSKYRRVVWHRGVSNDLLSMEEVRGQGKCPLTPEEVSIVLAGLGFPSTTLIYLASYKVYGGEARMAHLRDLYPHVVDKYKLTTDAEMEPFTGKSSQLAALDYHVSLHSDAFMSASRGNMHNALVGHRAYEADGLTLRLDMVLLAQLLGNRTISWDDFREGVRNGHKQRMGQVIMRKPTQSIYTYPAPDCMCGPGGR